MKWVRARTEDAACILALQKLAYRSEAELYGDATIPPLLQTLEDLQTEFSTKVIWKAHLDGIIVGSVRAWEREGTCFIERLIVHPDFQGRGIGTRLMIVVEMEFPSVQRFELFTGHKSERNLRLYARLGYQAFRQQIITPTLSFIYLEKRR